jgi:hypothetical protein
MQITEQIIERISRKVFNTMFSPALRQSNVVMGGSGSSVSWADNAGHANEADNAGSASSVPWSGVDEKPAYATRWPSWAEVTSKPTSKTIWGQTYLDASSNFQNVSGALSSVTNLTMSGKLKIGNIYIEAQTDYIEIYRLNDQNEKIDASLCAYGGVSALGVGTGGGGGGGGTSLQAVWTAMGNATDEQINISHLATALAGYATQQWVGQQGYITASGSCNYATSAGNADTVDDLHDTDLFRKIDNSKDINFADSNNKNGIIYINKDGDNGTTTGFWGNYGSVLNINSSAANWQLGVDNGGAFKFRHRWWSAGGNDWSGWLNIMTSDNCSVSKSDSTLTVKINGTSCSLTDTNTWRPVVDNLTSTDTDKSLSANQGKVLKGYIDTLNGYFDASGNAKSALKLTTVSKTAWGQTFWTSGGVPDSIDGNMSNVGDISFSASGKSIGGFLYFDTILSRLGVGKSSPSYALDVNGGAAFAGDVVPADDYATTEYNLGTTSKRWDRVRAQYVELTGTAPAVHVGSTTLTRISLHWSSDSNRGLYDYTNAWVIATNGTNTFLMKGNVGIGTTSPSYKLHVNGDVYATGGVTCLSDIRKKDVIERQVKLSIDDIANAPLIYYSLKGESAHKVRLGSVAQYWANILPETVNKGADGVLSMQYDVQALTSVIALAREVKRLKEEVERLKKN